MKRYILTVIVSFITVILFHLLLLWIHDTCKTTPNFIFCFGADMMMLIISALIFNAMAYDVPG